MVNTSRHNLKLKTSRTCDYFIVVAMVTGFIALYVGYVLDQFLGFYFYIWYILCSNIGALYFKHRKIVRKYFWLTNSVLNMIMALMALPLLLEGNTIPGLASLGFEYVISICVFTAAFSMLLQNIKYLNKILIYVIVSTSSLWLVIYFFAVAAFIIAIPLLCPSGPIAWILVISIWLLTLMHPISMLYVIKQNLQELKQYD